MTTIKYKLKRYIKMMTPHFNSKVKLDKFSGEDAEYEEWKFKLNAFLGSQGLDESKPGDWTPEQRKELYYMIAQAVSGPAVAIVMDAPRGDGPAAMKALSERYDPQRVTAKFGMLRRIMTAKCSDDENPEEWVNEKLRAMRKLEGMGVTIQEVVLLGIVDNLPPKMKMLGDMIRSREMTDLGTVKRLIVETHDAQQRTEVDTTALLATKAVSKPTCMWCGEAGHWARNCPHQMTVTAMQRPGKGKGKGARCWTCGKVGHLSATCVQYKSAHASVAQLLQSAVDTTE